MTPSYLAGQPWQACTVGTGVSGCVGVSGLVGVTGVGSLAGESSPPPQAAMPTTSVAVSSQAISFKFFGFIFCVVFVVSVAKLRKKTVKTFTFHKINAIGP